MKALADPRRDIHYQNVAYWGLHINALCRNPVQGLAPQCYVHGCPAYYHSHTKVPLKVLVSRYKNQSVEVLAAFTENNNGVHTLVFAAKAASLRVRPRTLESLLDSHGHL